MIAESALIAWIILSLVLFATMPPLRTFLLTYIVGLLFLPVQWRDQGVIILTQSLRLDKLAACHIGAVLGTLAFAPQVLRRYRFHWIDAAYGVVVVGMFATSLVNGLGPKDGLSNSVDNMRIFLPVLILSRLYITTVGELHQAMRAVIGGAFVYAFICMAEFRLAPQSHNLVYGYFQHDFAQFMRDGHFRPVGFLRHAIELSAFMGTSAALALWLWHKNLLKPLWGLVPGAAVVVTLLIGLACTLTFSGYAAFLICVGALGLGTLVRSRWVLVILPVAAIVWMGGRYTNAIDANTLLQLAKWVSPERAASLQYRLDAERANFAAASENLMLGKSATNGVAKDTEGRMIMAVDAWWMITLDFFGLVGLAGWYVVWSAGLIVAFVRWKTLTPDLRTLALVVSVMVGAQFIDFLFNAFPSIFLLMLNAGLVSAIQRYKPVKIQRRPVPVQMSVESSEVPGAALQ